MNTLKTTIIHSLDSTNIFYIAFYSDKCGCRTTLIAVWVKTQIDVRRAVFLSWWPERVSITRNAAHIDTHCRQCSGGGPAMPPSIDWDRVRESMSLRETFHTGMRRLAKHTTKPHCNCIGQAFDLAWVPSNTIREAPTRLTPAVQNDTDYVQNLSITQVYNYMRQYTLLQRFWLSCQMIWYCLG